MSRSRVYQCVSLSESQRLALCQEASRGRDLSQFNRLQRALDIELARLPTGSDQLADVVQHLSGRIQSAEQLDQLASMAGEIDRLTAPAGGSAPELGVAQKLALVRAELQLEGIERKADDLSIPIPQVAEVRGLLDQAKLETGQGRGDRARALLDRAGGQLAEADDVLNEGLVADQCRRSSLEVITRSLADMGYQIDRTETLADGIRLSAEAEDGRTAEVSISGTDEVNVDSAFTDPGTAVDPGHPDADEDCEQAGLDQITLAKALRNAGDLVVEHPETIEPPKRGVRLSSRRRGPVGRGHTKQRSRRAT